MDINESKSADVTVAALAGRLDTATAAAAEAKLVEMLEGGAKVVADMAEVRYVSSAGLRVLLKAAKHAKSNGAQFAVAGLQPSVREVLVASGFDRILQIYATRSEAVSGLA